MQQSERKLRRILGIDRPWYFRIIDAYIDRPVISDVILSLTVVGIKFLFSKKIGYCFEFEVSALTDILNELISSSLAAGGFVLAALAIIASIKQSVPEISKSDKPKNGKEYFYNSIGYPNIIKMYGISCVVFLVSFLYFSFIRATVLHFDGNELLDLILFGISLLSFTFLRCIAVLWSIIKI